MKNEPLKHLHFDLLRSPLEEQPFRYEAARIAAQVADLTDRAITEAMIAAAQHEGLTDLYLIDRQFLFEAIKEKVEREKNEPLTLDELGKMRDEPVWVQSPGVPEYGRWAIVAGVDTDDGDKILYLHSDFTCHEYGRVWLAYRHKPKEATT